MTHEDQQDIIISSRDALMFSDDSDSAVSINDTDDEFKVKRPYDRERIIKGMRNIDYMRGYMKEYYHTHSKEKVECPTCNKIVVKCKLIRHQKTPLCQKKAKANQKTNDKLLKDINKNELQNKKL